MTIEVLNGGEEGGDVKVRLDHYLPSVIPGTGEVKPDTIFLAYLQNIKEKFSKLVMRYVGRFSVGLFFRFVFLEVDFQNISVGGSIGYDFFKSSHYFCFTSSASSPC